MVVGNVLTKHWSATGKPLQPAQLSNIYVKGNTPRFSARTARAAKGVTPRPAEAVSIPAWWELGLLPRQWRLIGIVSLVCCLTAAAGLACCWLGGVFRPNSSLASGREPGSITTTETQLSPQAMDLLLNLSGGKEPLSAVVLFHSGLLPHSSHRSQAPDGRHDQLWLQVPSLQVENDRAHIMSALRGLPALQVVAVDGAVLGLPTFAEEMLRTMPTTRLLFILDGSAAEHHSGDGPMSQALLAAVALNHKFASSTVAGTGVLPAVRVAWTMPGFSALSSSLGLEAVAVPPFPPLQLGAQFGTFLVSPCSSSSSSGGGVGSDGGSCRRIGVSLDYLSPLAAGEAKQPTAASAISPVLAACMLPNVEVHVWVRPASQLLDKLCVSPIIAHAPLRGPQQPPLMHHEVAQFRLYCTAVLAAMDAVVHVSSSQHSGADGGSSVAHVLDLLASGVPVVLGPDASPYERDALLQSVLVARLENADLARAALENALRRRGELALRTRLLLDAMENEAQTGWGAALYGPATASTARNEPAIVASRHHHVPDSTSPFRVALLVTEDMLGGRNDEALVSALLARDLLSAGHIVVAIDLSVLCDAPQRWRAALGVGVAMEELPVERIIQRCVQRDDAAGTATALSGGTPAVSGGQRESPSLGPVGKAVEAAWAVRAAFDATPFDILELPDIGGIGYELLRARNGALTSEGDVGEQYLPPSIPILLRLYGTKQLYSTVERDWSPTNLPDAPPSPGQADVELEYMLERYAIDAADALLAPSPGVAALYNRAYVLDPSRTVHSPLTLQSFLQPLLPADAGSGLDSKEEEEEEADTVLHPKFRLRTTLLVLGPLRRASGIETVAEALRTLFERRTDLDLDLVFLGSDGPAPEICGWHTAPLLLNRNVSRQGLGIDVQGGSSQGAQPMLMSDCLRSMLGPALFRRVRLSPPVLPGALPAFLRRLRVDGGPGVTAAVVASFFDTSSITAQMYHAYGVPLILSNISAHVDSWDEHSAHLFVPGDAASLLTAIEAVVSATLADARDAAGAGGGAGNGAAAVARQLPFADAGDLGRAYAEALRVRGRQEEGLNDVAEGRELPGHARDGAAPASTAQSRLRRVGAAISRLQGSGPHV